MKRLIFLIVLICLANFGKSQNQEGSVEKSTFGIQLGFLGIWAHNEAKLSNRIALRSEVGFNSQLFGSYRSDKTGFSMTPVFTLEPRWYYSLKKRSSKGKRISGNHGGFVSLKTSFTPDWFVISNYEDLRVINQLFIIPKWGIRKNIGNHFTFEGGIGFGFRRYFAKSAGYANNANDTVFELHFRLGYMF